MITKGYKQTLKTRRRLGFSLPISLSLYLYFLFLFSNLLVGGFTGGLPRSPLNSFAESIRRYAPHDKVNSDAETFALPGLPDDNIIFTNSKIPYWFKEEGTGYGQLLDEVLKSELKSYGVIVNSFYKLEPAYAEYFKNEMGRKVCLIGPVCLFIKAFEEKAERGAKNSIDGNTILKWLDSKQPELVLYVSFGSQASMAPEQFLEVAHGLETSGCPFIWVDISEYGQEEKEKKEGGENRCKKLPEGFEKRMTLSPDKG
ncbi:hypothetical protein ACSBR2_030854 [Camellia fascicularis]